MTEWVVAEVVATIRVNPPWHKFVWLLEGEIVQAHRIDGSARWQVRPLPGVEGEPWHSYAHENCGIEVEKENLKILLDLGNELHKHGVEVYL